MLTPIKSSLPVLIVMISSMSVPICKRFYARQANSGKITSFESGGVPLFLSFEGTPSPSGMKFRHEILETIRYHMRKTRSRYLTCAWVGTVT